MATEAQQNVQRAVEEMLDTLEKQRIRPLLREAHMQSARCCEDQGMSKEQLQECMQRSFTPAQKVQEVVTNELNQLQARLSRCAQQCQDNAQDKVSSGQQDMSQLQAEMDRCVVKCCDDRIQTIPQIFSRITETMKSIGGAGGC